QKKQANKVFNDAPNSQIKARLKLNPAQHPHWPAVEAAPRQITDKKGSKRPRKQAAGDPQNPPVQQPKNAATPPRLSFSAEQQKTECRQLARLMGFEQIASSF